MSRELARPQPDRVERRIVPALQWRSTRATANKPPRVSGYGAVFDSPAEIGPFVEVVRAGAFARTLRERGVRLDRYERLKTAQGIAPAQWKFDSTDWWLEEHGLIMEKPDFPIPPGKYLVTGDRAVTTVLTIHPSDRDGNQRWELGDGAKIYDVTHLACRSARYTPAVTSKNSCSPANARKTAFPLLSSVATPV